MRPRALESAAVGVLGGVFGAVFGGFVGSVFDMRTELALAGAAVGALNGALSGARGIYDWGCSHGPIGFTLDSTWALPMTTLAVVANGYSLARSNAGYSDQLSRRQNRHVHAKGFVLRPGFAVTLGNYIGGGGQLDKDGRRLLVTDHEDVHVWQARWFGPFFLVILAVWWVIAAPAGLVIWLARGRTSSLPKVIETCGYYSNPFEWWAYSRHGVWRPRKMVAGVGWSRPIVQPLAKVRALRAGRADRATPR